MTPEEHIEYIDYKIELINKNIKKLEFLERSEHLINNVKKELEHYTDCKNRLEKEIKNRLK